MSEVWGGRSFLLIPTDGARIKDKFWELLEAYSPDHLTAYNLTFSDIEKSQPAEYARVRQGHKDAWDKAGRQGNFDEWFSQSAAHSLVDQLVLSSELEKQLIDRLSPFHFQGRAVQHRISRASGFGFPFTKIRDIISFTTSHIGQIVLPKPIEDPAVALLIHSQTGLATPAYCEELKAQNFAAEPLPDNYPTVDFVEHVLGGRPLFTGPQAGRWQPSDDYMPRTPFGLSMLHLGQYYEADLHHDYKEPLVVVVGDTIDDFCLYYSLSRLHERVCWLPLTWLRDCYQANEANRRRYERGEDLQNLSQQQMLGSKLVNLFFQLIDFGQGEKYIELRSMSLSIRQLIAYRRQMTACCLIDSAGFTSKTLCALINLDSTACILRVFEQDNYANNESMVFINGESVSPFSTPKPKNFTEVLPSRHYWVTSLRIEGYEPPQLPSLGMEIIKIHGLANESRVANDGIAYHCPNVAYFGGGIDVNTVRPKINLPDEMGDAWRLFR
jgi:hypothetical protein